jgi:hypothetical protein
MNGMGGREMLTHVRVALWTEWQGKLPPRFGAVNDPKQAVSVLHNGLASRALLLFCAFSL